jgi:transmembrane sensor
MSANQTSRFVEAAAWRIRLAEMNVETTQEFETWLRSDSLNAAAWQQVQQPWNLLGEQATSPEIIKLRRAALAHAHEASRGRWDSSKRFALTMRLAAAIATIAIVAGGWFTWHINQPDIYSTRAGERRVVTLVDGSQIALDSQSEVRVRYTVNARELTLASGQARFNVAHDAGRPFKVSARGHQVIATGTAFNVDLFGSNMLVTLIEGHVVVLQTHAGTSRAKPNDPAKPAVLTNVTPLDPARITLDAGEQLLLSTSAPPRIVHVNVERAVAWENGEVIFENDPMTVVVARLNRYSRYPLLIEDDQTSELRISGVFHTGDIDGFVDTIVSYLPIRAEKAPDGSTRLAHL